MTTTSQRLVELRYEQDRRDREMLKVYRPTHHTEAVHRCTASELISRGGKRCIAGSTMIYDPVAEMDRQVDQIKGDFFVYSRRPEDGELIITKAERPFTKGYDEFFKVELDNGESFIATAEHLVLGSCGWSSVSHLIDKLHRGVPCLLVSNSDTCQQGFPRDVRHSSQTIEGSLGDCLRSHRFYDGQLLGELVAFQDAAPLSSGVQARDLYFQHLGDLAYRFLHSRPCLRSDRLSSLYAQCRTFDPVAASQSLLACKPYSRLLETVRVAVQSLRQSFDRLRTIVAYPQAANRFAFAGVANQAVSGCGSPLFGRHSQLALQPQDTRVQTHTVAPFHQHHTCYSSQSSVTVEKETARRVTKIVSVGKGLVWDFEVPETGNYCLAGIVHHNSGKSVCISTEFAARVTGQDIIAADGSIIKNPWPKPTLQTPRLYWIIGYETRHIGETIHRLLFQPGQGGSFRCIRDLKTGLWRTWNRADPEDVSRSDESKLTEPLISDRYIDSEASWSWEDKKANQFNTVVLNNGATIRAYPSSSVNPKQGDAVSGIWIDEDIKFPHHLKEWQDRLTDMEGWFMWSVWPHTKNDALLNLLDRAEMSAMDEHSQIRSFQLIMTDNPYLSDKGKAESLGRMESEDEIARRNRGDTLVHELNMYNYVSEVHEIKAPRPGYKKAELPPAHEYLRDMLVTRKCFPHEWTRYLSIDPSNTRTAVHSWVVPPRTYQNIEFGDLAICEWEMIAKAFSAGMLAKALSDKMSTRNYEAFIMDKMAGRQTHAGRDDNTFGVYSAAFKLHGLFSRLTSFSFVPGCSERSTFFRAVRELMREDPDTGIPHLMFVEETTGETKNEFNRFRKKKETRGEGFETLLDEPANPRLFDAMASLQYFAAYIEVQFAIGQAWVDPINYRPRPSGAARFIRAEMAKLAKKQESDVVYLGAGDYSSSAPW